MTEGGSPTLPQKGEDGGLERQVVPEGLSLLLWTLRCLGV